MSSALGKFRRVAGVAKQHKMTSTPLWKIKGYNLIQQKTPKTKPADRVERWNVFVGDTVQIMSGAAKGERGKVTAIDRKNNLVFVEGKRLLKKHIPRTPQTPNGGTFSMEAGIHASNVALVDPRDNEPTKVRWQVSADEATGKTIRRRISRLSDMEIPKPVFDPSILEKKRPKDNAADTLLEAVQRQTYFPSLARPPLPGDLRLKDAGLW